MKPSLLAAAMAALVMTCPVELPAWHHRPAVSPVQPGPADDEQVSDKDDSTDDSEDNADD